MAAPVKKIKVGQCEVCQWSGEYEGKPTVSYSANKQKLDPKTNKWEDSKFLNLTDLKDFIHALDMMVKAVYAEKNGLDVKKEEAPF